MFLVLPPSLSHNGKSTDLFFTFKNYFIRPLYTGVICKVAEDDTCNSPIPRALPASKLHQPRIILA